MFVVLTALIQPALSKSNVSGNDLLKECSAKNKSFCQGYLIGIVDGMDQLAVEMFNPENEVDLSPYQSGIDSVLEFCFPPNMEFIQIIDLVVLFLEENPGIRHFTADSLAFSAIREAFPCE